MPDDLDCNPLARTRPPILKSCLKLTPPITPDLSAAPSPCTSGRTSPSFSLSSSSDNESRCSSSCCAARKTVSFCGEDELEEVFFADEWDRSPAAVTPKLSYQDILELKQLRINLPYNTPPPPPRQPFTTSLPSSKSNFPISRLATATSHTPSKWKNRSEPRHEVDPAILPYLEAVPIRLLPLLPQAPSPEPEHEPDTDSDAPETHPQTPTPTASPEARATVHPPLEPPELRIIEPAIPHSSPSPSLPASASAATYSYSSSPATTRPVPPQPKKPNFAFLPLLPIMDAPAQPAPLVQSAPPPARRKFNMTFLPVNAIPDPPSEPSSLPQPASTDAAASADVGRPNGGAALLPDAPLLSPPSSRFGLSDPRQAQGDAGQQSILSLPPSTAPACTRIAPSMSPPPTPPLTLSLALASTKLHLPLMGESDTDTDNYTDTDAESDAPSTSTVASSVPSPPCEFEGPAAGELEGLELGVQQHTHTHAHAGSYFPPVPHLEELPGEAQYRHPHSLSLSSGPGQTPPLSVLYPSPETRERILGHAGDALGPSSSSSLRTQLLMPEAGAGSSMLELMPPLPPLVSTDTSITEEGSLPTTPLLMHGSLLRKAALCALPSPCLVPPSPFELEPRVVGCVGVMGKEAAESVVSTPGGSGEPSPMLTLEGVRAAWDAKARERIASAKGEMGMGVGGIAPSLSRRRMSSS